MNKILILLIITLGLVFSLGLKIGMNYEHPQEVDKLQLYCAGLTGLETPEQIAVQVVNCELYRELKEQETELLMDIETFKF